MDFLIKNTDSHYVDKIDREKHLCTFKTIFIRVKIILEKNSEKTINKDEIP